MGMWGASAPWGSGIRPAAQRQWRILVGVWPWLPLLMVSLASLAAPAIRRGNERLQWDSPGVLRSFVRQVALERNQSPGQPLRPGTPIGYGDRLRTFAAASAEVEFANRDVLTLWEKSVLEIRRQPSGASAPSLLAGEARFTSIGAKEKTPVVTPEAVVTHTKTELLIKVSALGTEVLVLDGDAELTNDFGRQALRRGERGIAEPGQKPRRLPALRTAQLIQWWIYYPAVLDPRTAEAAALADPRLIVSAQTYARGNLVEALHAWPGFPEPISPSSREARVLLAALWLGVGHLANAQSELAGLPAEDPESRALKRLIGAATEGAPAAPENTSPSPARESAVSVGPSTASDWLAQSYEDQSRYRIEAALASARRSLSLSPNHGYARAREAELLFALGRLPEAAAAAKAAADLVPDHAEVLVVQGFAALSQNQFALAEAAFDAALERQSRLADAWLGRALVLWRRGRTDEALEAFRLAVGTEPERSLARSYLGKALADAGNGAVAREEWRRARELDSFDPTPALYEALLDRAENRPVSALENLHRAQALNDARAVFRGRHLLDEDRAVRSANLAGVYLDLGLTPQANSEGALALAGDLGNESAHRFLASTYQQRRDPRQGDVRYETPWFSEYLLANLLAPPGAGLLSASVSQNEYSRLLQRDGPGIASETVYHSRGVWQQGASQYGTWAGSEYALDSLYYSDPGPAANRDVEHLTLSLQYKQQLGPRDTAYLQVVRYTAEGGDPSPSFSGQANQPGQRFSESQEPLVLLGHHHAWSPSARTLFLAGFFDSHLEVTNRLGSQYLGILDPTPGTPAHLLLDRIRVGRETDFRGASFEVQQQQSLESHEALAGVRWQAGEISSASSFLQRVLIPNPPVLGGALRSRLDPQQVSPDFQNFAAYAYDTWRILEPLRLVAGITYDHREMPANAWSSPLTEGTRSLDQISPAVGVIYTPWTNATWRAAWTRSLGGMSFEQSLRLEPVQVAGFVHGWRGVMPQPFPGQEMESLSLGYDHQFPTRTYASLEFSSTEAVAAQFVGFVAVRNRAEQSGATLREAASYRQNRLRAEVRQVLHPQLVVGVGYEFSDTRFDRRLIDYPDVLTTEDAEFHQLQMELRWLHPGGWFAVVEGSWNHQSGRLDPATRFDEESWTANAYVGWRERRRRVEITLGIENLTDTEVLRSSVSGLPEGPLERAAVVSARFQF